MAVPVIASSTSDTTQGTSNTTVILSQPSGLQAGDLIVLLFADEQGELNDCPDLSGQGFTRITHGNNSADCQMAIYYKIATGGESWPITIAGTTGDYAVGWALRITGVNTSTPIHQTGSFAGVGSTGSSIAAPEVTTTIDDCLGLAFACYDGSDIAPASVSGTGWGLVASLEDPANSYGGAAADYATKQLTSAGATVDCTFIMGGSDGRVAIQIAIAPGAGGGIDSVSPSEFDMDDADVDINGTNFGSSQGSGTVYISDANTLAGSPNEVDITNAVNTWSDTLINLDLTQLSGTELDYLHTLGPGARYIIVLTDASDEYSSSITLHRPQAWVMSLGAGTPGATTARLNPPTSKTTGDFDAGRFEEVDNPAATVDITADDYTEMVWSIEAQTLARDVSYRFRVTANGTPLDTYSVNPQTTVTSEVFEEGAAVLAASGDVTAVGTIEHAATVALDAIATLTAVASPEVPAQVILSAVGSQTAVATVDRYAAVQLAATGSVNAVASPDVLANVALSAAAIITAAATAERPGITALSAAATLTAVASPLVSASSALSATATITAIASADVPAAAGLSVSSTLSAVSKVEHVAATSLHAAGGMTAAATKDAYGITILTGAATVTAIGAVGEEELGATVLSGVATVTATGAIEGIQAGAAVLAAVGTVTASAIIDRAANVTLFAVGTQIASGVRIRSGAVNLISAGTLIADGSVGAQELGSAVLSAIATLTATATNEVPAAVILSATGTITAAATVGVQITGAATLIGVGSLTTNGTTEYGASVTVAGACTVTASASLEGEIAAEVVLTGVATLTAAGSYLRQHLIVTEIIMRPNYRGIVSMELAYSGSIDIKSTYVADMAMTSAYDGSVNIESAYTTSVIINREE